MTFGNQTVTLVKRSPSATPDELGTYPMTETLVDMPGCTHRPIRPEGLRGAGMARAEETPAVGVSSAIVWWRTTVPLGAYSAALRAQVLGAQASDRLFYHGETFEIITEPEQHPDFNLPGYKLTFTSERQSIGT